MASEELQVVLELLRGTDLDAMTVPERRAATASVAEAPAGTRVAAADAGGVPAEWVTPPGVAGGRVIMHLHGGAYQLGSPATLRHVVALLSAAAPGAVPAAAATLRRQFCQPMSRERGVCRRSRLATSR